MSHVSRLMSHVSRLTKSHVSRLILASASPQRKVLLEGLGMHFEVIPSEIDEDGHSEQSPVERAVILARLKAEDIANKNRGSIVIGCDTLVVAVETRGARVSTILEKPKDEADAKRMIHMQSGRISLVHSALCIVDPSGKIHEGISTSRVTFKKLSPKDIDWWISTGFWRGRSGAFQIDGPGQLMISHIEGDWTGIVGLPVFLFGELIKQAGFQI